MGEELSTVLASMTGFGEARGQADGLAVVVEVRTINSRHFKLNYRSSEGYASLEPDIEALVRKEVRRGTVQLNLRVDRQASSEDYRINITVLEAYRGQLETITGSTGIADAVELTTLLQLPGVIDEKGRTDYKPQQDWPFVKQIVCEALAAVSTMRSEEGAALADDLKNNCEAISEFLNQIAKRSPHVVEYYQKRLVERVNQSLAELNVTVEPADLVREVSLFVDRSDISEEIVRLRSHLQQFEAATRLSESSGRKLEFIAQEMGREINTIGSKANDADISHGVVEIKAALERIREQIQNVE